MMLPMLQLRGGSCMVVNDLHARVRAAQQRLNEASYEEEVAFAMLRRARAMRDRAAEDMAALVNELTHRAVPAGEP